MKSGNEASCFCPFHDNTHSPAFRFNMHTGLWCCYVCKNGKGQMLAGNVDMLAKMLGAAAAGTSVTLDDLDAELRAMMLDAGPNHGGEGNKPISEDTLAGYMTTDWWITARGFSRNTVAEWELGYDPMEDAATIPIRDIDGKLVAVGLRYLDPHPLKYRYPKGFKRNSVLYGLHKVTGTEVALVEGPLDALSCWEAGIPAVAQFGSNLSHQQVKLLRRAGITHVTLLYDNDKAGKAAVFQALDRLRGVVVRVPTYSKGMGKDPGEWPPKTIQRLYSTGRMWSL